ncbi:MAG: hypothetical protein LBR28_07090 [Bacteroidales bacterium]|jgi:hypothetical protein|nr:hypothetical protein [Bacteroidales bacterium]
MFLLLLCIVANAQETTSEKFSVQNNLELYTGFNFIMTNKPNFEIAKDMSSYQSIMIGLRYKAFKEMICLQADYSLQLPFQNFNNVYIGGVSIDYALIKFKQSYISLGIRYQNMFVSFDANNNGIVDKYSIKNTSSLGPILRYKNRAFNIEAGYLFALNKQKWNSVLNITELPSDEFSSFILKFSVNVPLIK